MERNQLEEKSAQQNENLKRRKKTTETQEIPNENDKHTRQRRYLYEERR